MPEFSEILKNETVVRFAICCSLIIMLLLLLSQKWVKFLPLQMCKTINYIVLTIMTLLIIFNALLTTNYNRLWMLLFSVVFYALQYFLPKFRQWFDNKADALADKISDKF